MAADPKPAARIVDPKAQPLDGTPLVTGICPLCDRGLRARVQFRLPLSRHHVVPKGQGGDDVPENLVWSCGDGTSGCHGVLTHRNRDGESGLTFKQVGEALVDYVLCDVPEVNSYAARKKHATWLIEYYAPHALEEAA